MSDEIVAVRRLALKKQLHNLYALFVVGAGAVVLALPMLIYGPYPLGQDLAEHLIYNRYFSQQFWAGEWYPRWLMDINHGLGSPTFFVYSAFQAYVYAFLEPLTNALHLNTMVTEEFLVLIASGFAAFVWLRNFSSRQVATAAALLYMLAPYHLNIDFYVRDALPECWALVWIPLLLYFTSKIIERKRGAVIGFAIFYALLVLSHLLTVLIFSFVPVAAALLLPTRGERLRSVFGVASGLFLGLGLSSFYLIPALYNARNFPPERLTPTPSMFFGLFLVGIHNISLGGFFRAAALTGVDAIAVCAACGIAIYLKGRGDSKKSVSFWIVVSSIPAFMMCSISDPLWKRMPALLAEIQHPFRLNIILTVAVVAIVAVFMSDAGWAKRPFNGIRAALVLFVVVPWVGSYLVVWKDYLQLQNPRSDAVSQNQEHFGDDGLFSTWEAPGTDETSALQASLGPRVRFMTGGGTAKVSSWMPRHIEFQTSSSTGGMVMVNQFYYPAWQAILAPSAQVLSTKAAMPQGLVGIDVPPGDEIVRLDIPRQPAESLGSWVSILSVLLSLILVWRETAKQKPAS